MKTVLQKTNAEKKFCILSRLMILLGSFLFTTITFAESTGNLSIRIQGDILKSVSVVVSGGDLSESLEKKTSSSGIVVFKDLAAGTYTVTPRKLGYQFSPLARNLNVIADKTIRIKMTATKSVDKVGMAYCVSCHKKVSSDVYADWLAGPHGNFEYVDASHHQYNYDDFTSSFTYPTDYTKFTGFPTEAEIIEDLKDPAYAGKSKAYCLNCHGMSSKDNTRVANFPLVRPDGTVDTINSSKQVSRPVIGCEACHGSGRTHISRPKKSLTYNEPGAVQCGQCHNKNFPEGHLTYHPSGAAGANNPGIYEAYSVSAHTQSIDESSLYSDAKKKNMKALCAKCHSDQGARIYRAKDGDVTTLPPLLTGEADHKEFSAIQCRTCHNAHNPGQLLENASAATNTATARSAVYNTCTNCHQLLDGSDAKITPYHNDHAKSITNNHYDNPATQALEGYNVRRGSTACLDCHNPHVANLKINEQWAESGHGELTGDAWLHYDWKAANRQACQRCHTPVGFAGIAANQLTYNPANNDFSHLSGLQNETLSCYSCHEDDSYKRREMEGFDGKVEFPYHITLRTTPTPAALTPVPLTDGLVTLGTDNNLCMRCHQGRESKITVDYVVARGAPPYTSFVNEHYFAAAATFFGSETHGGYEYSGKTYVTRSTFPGHEGDKLNTCVKCHLRLDSTDAPDHRFVPQVSDCAGSSCHTGVTSFAAIRPSSAVDYDGDGNTTEGIKGEIDTIEAALYTTIKYYAANTLSISGVHYPIVYDEATNPYWFRDLNNNGIKDGSDSSFNKFDAKLLRACFNYHHFIKEPHGYIHNYKYILQLLYDSIQDLGGDVSQFTRPS